MASSRIRSRCSVAQEALGVDLVDVLGARRAGREPAVLGDHLDPAEGGAVGRGRGQHVGDRLAGQLRGLHVAGGQPLEHRLLLGGGRGVDPPVGGVAEAGGELAVLGARVGAAAGGHLGGQQAADDAVLVGGPDGPVAAQERGPGALLAAEAERAVQQPVHEPLEPDRDLVQPPAQVGRHPVDHRAGDHRLADPDPLAPVAPAAEQVGDHRGQVVVGVEQPGAAGDDAVPVGVGVVGEGHVEAVAQVDQPGHGVARGRVHADLAVPVDGHEPEGGVDRLVDHLQLQPVVLGDGRPVVDRRPAQGVDAQAQPGPADRLHVHDGGQVLDVGGHVVVALHAGGAGGPLGRDPPHPVQAGPQQPVGLVLDPAGDVGVGRAAVGRVVLEAAVLGRVVGGGDHDAVGQVVAPVPVPGQDGQRQRRGRGRPVARVDPHLDPVGGQHLQGGALGRLGQGVGVAAQEQRPVDPLWPRGSGRWPRWWPGCGPR